MKLLMFYLKDPPSSLINFLFLILLDPDLDGIIFKNIKNSLK